MHHRGRTGDSDEELTTLRLLFEESGGDPLTTGEAQALIENLRIYRDTGSGVFETTVDTLVTTVPSGTLVLVAGEYSITFTDEDLNVQLPFGPPITYFVVLQLTTDAANQTPNQLQITHLLDGANPSSGEDRAADIPLSLEFGPNVTTGLVSIIKLPVDLVISKSVTPTGPVLPGQPLTYTLNFNNIGLGTANNVIITDIIPITLTQITFNNSGATITPTGGVNLAWTVEPLTFSEGGSLR